MRGCVCAAARGGRISILASSRLDCAEMGRLVSHPMLSRTSTFERAQKVTSHRKGLSGAILKEWEGLYDDEEALTSKTS